MRLKKIIIRQLCCTLQARGSLAYVAPGVTHSMLIERMSKPLCYSLRRKTKIVWGNSCRGM